MPRQFIYECEACGHQMWVSDMLSPLVTGTTGQFVSQHQPQRQPQPRDEEPKG
jgi:hypothetical protein